MNTRKRIILAIFFLGVLVTIIGISVTMIKASNLPTPTADISCPTADATDIPICAPGGETITSPNASATADGPSLIGTPVGP